MRVSRKSRSRKFREVTYFPSRPAKGESFTEIVISIVGSEILTNGSGSIASGTQMVSPMVMSAMPDSAMILPAPASVTACRASPSNWYRLTAFARLTGRSP